MKDYTYLAEIAYIAYGRFTEFKNFQNNSMPEWHDLPFKIQDAWKAAVKEVEKKVIEEMADGH